MNRVKSVAKQTNNAFLNMYKFDVEYRNGSIKPYFNIENLEAKTHEHLSDAITIYAIYGEKKDKIVLVR